MSVKQFGNISIIVFVIWFSAYIYAPHLIIDLQFSPVLYSKEGKLLAAKVSEDGQWRFPPVDSLSYQYINCLKAFEDKRFDSHIGFDPIAFFRAILSNVKARKVNSGGSTITMQFARLLLGNPPRTLFNKIKETWIAIGIESNFTKDQILRYYSSVAPYGGNVVGIQAASWRYFQRNTLQLNWAESALLAVLPNQPSFMHLKKNRDALLQKRNRLLKKLWINNQLDLETYHLAILEPIPDQLFAMPKSGIHLLEYLKKKFPNQYKFNSTINLPIQQNFIEISTHHSRYLIENNIHNLSILLIDNKSSEVLSYVANTQLNSDIVKNGHVNNIHAARSSGSILKPILYACSLDRGLICPGTLLPDIPTLISGFRPENFSRTYEGALPAYQCIQRSLNIPSVRLLQWYGLENFYLQLKQGGFSTLFRTSDEYGLSLILGGAEVTAWDLAKVYSGLAQSLIEPSIPDNKKEISGMHVYKHNDKSLEKDPIITNISPTAIYQMIDCMKGSVLPDDLATQFYLENKHKIAWKTGTSFGFKDAWCIGITPEYTLVVWIGNSSGMGRPGLIGVHTAAPLLFELFHSLKFSDEWYFPYDESYKVRVCKQSGFLPSQFCIETDTIWNASLLEELSVCNYHKLVFLDPQKKYRVFQNCEPNLVGEIYFSIPPVMEYYYTKSHAEYKVIPPVRQDCVGHTEQSDRVLEFIYPDKGIEVYIPVDLDELTNEMIVKAVHKDDHSVVYWFLDSHYLGETSAGQHERSINPSQGTHFLKILDERGHSATAVIKCYKRSR